MGVYHSPTAAERQSGGQSHVTGPPCCGGFLSFSSAPLALWNCPVLWVLSCKDWRYIWHCPQGHGHSIFDQIFSIFQCKPSWRRFEIGLLVLNVITWYSVLLEDCRWCVTVTPANPLVEPRQIHCRDSLLWSMGLHSVSPKDSFCQHANKDWNTQRRRKRPNAIFQFKSIQKSSYLAQI